MGNLFPRLLLPRVAERLAGDTEPLREALAFHCQQAAERYLKALLVRHGIEFRKTHNIGELLDFLAPAAGAAAENKGNMVEKS